MKKKFILVWSPIHYAIGMLQEKSGTRFFSNKNGYEQADKKKVDALEVNEYCELEKGHIVIRKK